MIIINLISPEKKKENFWQRIFILSKNIISAFAILVGLITIIAYSAYYIINQSFHGIQKKQSSLQAQNKKINTEIKETNRTIARLKEIQDNYTSFSRILFFFSEITPHSITLKNIKIKKNEKKKNILEIQLSGIAKTRKDLLKYKDLFNKPPFSGVDLPFSDLLQQKNIEFNLQSRLDYTILDNNF